MAILPHFPYNCNVKHYIPVIVAVLIAAGAGIWYFIAPSHIPTTDISGTIQGATAYPSDFNPAQTVCAQLISNLTDIVCTNVSEPAPGAEAAFSITVKPGTYWVYAVIADPADLGLTESRTAYWTEFVKCGSLYTCKNHTKLEVVVGSGQTVYDIRPQDWYQ